MQNKNKPRTSAPRRVLRVGLLSAGIAAVLGAAAPAGATLISVGDVTVDGVPAPVPADGDLSDSALIVGNTAAGNVFVSSAPPTTSLVSPYVTLGENAGSEGVLTVVGPGALLASTSNPVNAPQADDLLIVGRGGAGRLGISNGARAESLSVVVGEAAGSNGSVLVSGPSTAGATWALHDLTAGGEGDASLLFEAGAEVRIFDDAVLGQGPGSVGDVTVTGSGTRLHMQGGLVVGELGSASLNVLDGATVLGVPASSSINPPPSLVVGANRPFGPPDEPPQSSILIAGQGSELIVPAGPNGFSIVQVGLGGAAQVTVEAGGRAALQADVTLGGANTSPLTGQRSPGTGSVNVSGRDPGGEASIFDVAGNLVVGEIGRGELSVSAGGVALTGGDAFVGQAGTDFTREVESAVSVTGAGSRWAIQSDLTLADALGRSASLTVANGGSIEVGVDLIVNADAEALSTSLLFGIGDSGNGVFESGFIDVGGELFFDTGDILFDLLVDPLSVLDLGDVFPLIGYERWEGNLFQYYDSDDTLQTLLDGSLLQRGAYTFQMEYDYASSPAADRLAFAALLVGMDGGSDPVSVPEPSTLTLLLAAMAGLAVSRRRSDTAVR